ncbi:uncharacterized protein A4U43_C04F20520, partial [Asparagus officinalis]
MEEGDDVETYLFKVVIVGGGGPLSRASTGGFKNSGVSCWIDLGGCYYAAHSDTTIARILVGNKCDLESIRAVSVEEGKNLAEAEGLFFIETSALDSTNVKTAFEIVIKEIYANLSRRVLNSDSSKPELSQNR